MCNEFDIEFRGAKIMYFFQKQDYFRKKRSIHDRQVLRAKKQHLSVLSNILLFFNNISDNKRQQTLTVDYKRLFNGLVLTDVFSLRHESNN